MKKKHIIIVLVGLAVVLCVAAFLIFRSTRQKKDNWENKRKQEVVENRDMESKVADIREHIDLQIKRYEKSVFAVDTTNMALSIKKLGEQYPDCFVTKDAWQNPMYVEQLKRFIQDPYIAEIYRDVMKKYSNLDAVQEELKTALSHYKYYFPDAKIPEFYTIVGGIDPGNPFINTYQNNVIINLDWYLGKDYKYYKDYRIPQFIREQCEPRNITLDCFRKSIAYEQLPQTTPITLLDNMIMQGKIIYLTEMVFPDTPVSDIIGYDSEKFAWAMNNQANIWNYLIEQNLLFSKDSDPIRRLIDEAPYSNPFTNNSPGRIGVFIGWMIIINYMENNPEISINQLMKECNSRTILDKSGYKPLKQ